jgi:hypothetical protein
MRVGREPIRVTVIRSEPDVPPEEPSDTDELPSSDDSVVPTHVGGRFMGLVRNALDRWRRR